MSFGNRADRSPSAPNHRAEGDPSAAIIEADGIHKSFNAVRALRGVSVGLHAGEVHGLVGANGAGKSTLIRVLAGIVHPDAGEVRIDGAPVTLATPRDSSAHGLAFLHQELNLVPKFNALQNMALGLTQSSRIGLAQLKAVRSLALETAARVGLDFDLERPVGDLSVAQRWLVALARSLMRDARMIALDEPTASLSAEEGNRLFNIIGSMAGSGIAVLYVSHRLEEITAICHRVTAFRDGQVVDRMHRGEISRDRLVHAITGTMVSGAPTASPARRGADREVLTTRSLNRAPEVRDVSITLRQGEITGLAGLVGAGRTELAELLFGVRRPDAGEIILDGRAVRLNSPADAIGRGIGMVPEERRSQALFLNRSATFNATISSTGAARNRLGLVSPRRGRRRAAEIVNRVDLRVHDIDNPVSMLSGGNQQKVVLARWLLTNPKVLILDEPTKGVDIGARGKIHEVLRSLADDGMALLVISSDFEELLPADRVLVMARGRIVTELVGPDITEQNMLLAAYETDALPIAVEE